MPRTVVHPSGGGLAAGGTPGDNYLTKLAKYVPAEVVSLFAALVAVTGLEETLLIAALVVGVILTPAYLYAVARSLPAAERPRPHFYALAALAFAIWAVGTTPAIRELLGVSDPIAAFALVLGVFLVPLLDTLLT